MTDSHHGMHGHHPRTAVAHHGTDLLPHLRLIAVRFAAGAECLVFHIGAFVAALMVDLALYGIHLLMPDRLTVPQVITLGAIATATAPAATLMVVKEYKAKGALTKLLLPIVALDDAVGLVVFAISFGIAKTMVSGQTDLFLFL